MAKLLLLSVLVVPLLVARHASTLRDPRRGARLTFVLALAFGFVYVVAVNFLYFKLL